MSQKRDRQILFWVSEQELAQIQHKMEQLGVVNMSAYLRKMAIDGYIVKLDIPELREMVSLLRRSSNNLNQIAKRVNATGRVYAADLEQMLQNQEEIWTGMKQVITRLAEIE